MPALGLPLTSEPELNDDVVFVLLCLRAVTRSFKSPLGCFSVSSGRASFEDRLQTLTVAGGLSVINRENKKKVYFLSENLVILTSDIQLLRTLRGQIKIKKHIFNI